MRKPRKIKSRAARVIERAADLGVDPISVSRQQAAAMISVDVQTIDRLIAAKKLKASHVLRRVVVDVADIRAMLEANAVQ